MRQTIHFKLFAMVAMCSIFIVGASEIVSKAPKGSKALKGKKNKKGSKSSNGLWYEDDTVVNLVPKFKIKDGMTEQFVALLPKFFDLVKANEEETCVHYGFVGPTEDGYIICREGYTSAEGVTFHLDNVGDVLNEALQYADIVELQVQGPAEEMEKLKEPLKAFGATFYPLSEGSFRSKSS
eukprot:CAMPEP_0194274102 /NCGR_PEP_ID=MMETSP0169-20130528/7275_1 /TAXON_ID=218684 /ORGANISM="Corethron pennatum, Strain L29A3" /LENGTH=180 /DNA_ID=CAMNT_0039017215 /DNA_START=20 /DNA_END=565 /DNA_ORIENTATION=-